MTSPRAFPPLKESDVRRLTGASVFTKAQRLWKSDAVLNPSVGAGKTLLLATVRDGQAGYQVMVQHLAGEEFSSRCDCDEAMLCAHAIALLLAWSQAAFAFARLESTGEASMPGDGLKQDWREYLVHASLSLLRAMARRHQIPLRTGERAAIVEQLIDRLSLPEAQLYALANLNEAQRRLLEMVYLLSDARPDTHADDLQEALGWASLSDVEGALGELREWGLVVSVPSRWHGAEPYSIAPGAGKLVADLARQRSREEQYYVQPRNICVEPFTGNLESARVERQTRYIPETVLLARHFPLRTRPPLPELAQARTQKALRHWTYDVDELVRLQVNPGWLHHGESVLTVPAPAPRLDDESQAALHLLTGDDALSDYLSYLTSLGAPDQAASGTPTQQEAFDDWLRLTTWSELWLAQNEHGLMVRRSLLGAPLAYGEWLNELARARRFVVRALALLNTGQWYDFATLLRFLHAIHADFLRNARGAAAQPLTWWLELNSEAVDVRDFDAWRATYGRFVEAVLAGPLRWFGAAELAFGAEQLIAFQITALGQALLHQQPLPAATETGAPLKLCAETTVCVPIGRGDMSPYLTLERIARFAGVRAGSAFYQFDAEHAYFTFESGLTVHDVLTQLEQLAQLPLPCSLRSRWQEWWARYDQVRMYHGLTLIEFADDYLLQELRAQTDIDDHLLFTFGTRLVALRPESADAVARQLRKKGYMPSVE